jgi:DNA-binding LacI/PurR family transcriptional regulator
MILNGEVVPGDLLPTIRELAERFDTSVFTVQAAMTPLEEEGLVERRRRVGTVVRHNPAVLTCAGIYSGSGLLEEWEYAFFRELSRELQRQLGGQNVESKLFADMRSTADHLKPMPDLVRAIDSREIQALFVVLSDQDNNPWLTRLPVTASFNASGAMPNRVNTDSEQMLRLSLTRLRERGCRTVGLISAIRIPRDHRHDYFKFYEVFTEIVTDLRMKTRDPWVITPQGHVADHEAYGYESFRRLWGKDDHPDGLLVYPDTSARGVMTAALELGVRVPEDIKMVFHHNTGVDWTCPLGVDWVENDTAQWAAEMIKQVRRQKAGEKIEEPTVLGYRIVETGVRGQESGVRETDDD